MADSTDILRHLTDEQSDDLYSEIGNYFLKSEQLHDVHFIVGENEERRRIGAVKSPLINQSHIWWNMLSPDSQLAETKDIIVPDIEPDIFVLMLKHCYSSRSVCENLSEENAVKLCYCANKYDMKTLMEHVADRLKPFDVNEVFAAMYCLLNFNLFGVEERVKEVVQKQTQEIFDHPKFLDCCSDSVVYICKQDKLKCTELELWCNVVNWAKHQVGRQEDGCQLRDYMLKPLQHIRLLTLKESNQKKHVFTQDILSGYEIECLRNRNVTDALALCKETSIREIFLLGYCANLICSNHFIACKKASSSIIIKNKTVYLKSLTLLPICVDNIQKGIKATFPTDVVIVVTPITHKGESVIVLKTEVMLKGKCNPIISTLVNGKEIVLSPNGIYKLDLEINGNYLASAGFCKLHNFRHFLFFCRFSSNDNACLIHKLNYLV